MWITNINLAKGENFSTCVWRKATKEEEEKVMNVLSKIKSKQ